MQSQSPAVVDALIYEPNRKHKEPWQSGQRGTLCPPASELCLTTVKSLLKESVLFGSVRYACHEGRAYAAHEHESNRWHGHPVGWVEVPSDIRISWLEAKKVQKRDIRRHWGVS